MRSIRHAFAIAVLFGGCQKDSSATTEADKAKTQERKLAGVYPEQFKCESVLDNAALGQVLGGEAHMLDSAMSVPRGLPHPCNYEVTVNGAGEYWTFDFDCRDGYKQRAAALFDQYRTGSTQMIDQYNAMADAGVVKANDAGVAITRPDPPVDVQVGAKGLDHHGQGLLFIDDDAPCYVRVIGPDAARRLELAKSLAKNLTFANAPMTPRPMP